MLVGRTSKYHPYLHRNRVLHDTAKGAGRAPQQFCSYLNEIFKAILPLLIEGIDIICFSESGHGASAGDMAPLCWRPIAARQGGLGGAGKTLAAAPHAQEERPSCAI
jgi:hypothetical protein